jgi:hypothetical protein
MPPSKILESRRGCTGGGGSLPSEKPNHPSECGQSEYERDEIELLLCAPNPPPFRCCAYRRPRSRNQMGL